MLKWSQAGFEFNTSLRWIEDTHNSVAAIKQSHKAKIRLISWWGQEYLTFLSERKSKIMQKNYKTF